MKKLTPILTVDSIEPSLPFWVDALGFTKTVEVPHGEALGFAILEKDGYEVMLQSVASMQADVPAVAPPSGGSVVFLEIDDLSAIEEAVAGYELLVPRRKTFYGAEEIFVREPAGTWSASRSSASRRLAKTPCGADAPSGAQREGFRRCRFAETSVFDDLPETQGTDL